MEDRIFATASLAVEGPEDAEVDLLLSTYRIEHFLPSSYRNLNF